MTTLVRDGLELHYEVRGGSGPAGSSRLYGSVPYRVGDLANDLIAVVQAVGFDRIFVLGYSFTGAFPSLATTPTSTRTSNVGPRPRCSWLDRL